MSAKTIKNLKDRMAAVREEMKKVGREALQGAFDDFFAKVPEAEAIVWTQYTPYFNDGDTCEFGVHEICLKLNKESRQKLLGEEVDDDDQEEWLNNFWESDSYSLAELDDSRAETISELFSELYHDVVDEDLFLATFGDHVSVTVTRDGIRADDYEHD